MSHEQQMMFAQQWQQQHPPHMHALQGQQPLQQGFFPHGLPIQQGWDAPMQQLPSPMSFPNTMVTKAPCPLPPYPMSLPQQVAPFPQEYTLASNHAPSRPQPTPLNLPITAINSIETALDSAVSPPPLSTSGSSIASSPEPWPLSGTVNPMLMPSEEEWLVKSESESGLEPFPSFPTSRPVTPGQSTQPRSPSSPTASVGPASHVPESSFCCDPRELTSAGALDASLVQTLSPASLQLTGEAATAADLNNNGSHTTPNTPGYLFPSSDELSDTDGVEEFLDILSTSSVAGRSRSNSDLTDLDDYKDWIEQSDEPEAKRRKTGPTMDLAAEANTEEQKSTETQQTQDQQAQTPTKEGDIKPDTAQSGAENPSTPLSTPAPGNRRGRKQSLTEDPSKSFACDLCTRRFRRQEHLKRHHRSLHTKDKPFECPDCGKKFSRSDNLTQHARTHGAGAISLDVGPPEMSNGFGIPMFASGLPPNVAQYGHNLYQTAADIPGSSSEGSSGDESHGGSHGKRKRAD